MPPDAARSRQVLIPEHELQWQFARASGPGGQGVNTADSRARLRWNLVTSSALTDEQRDRALRRLAGRLVNGELLVNAAEYRSQARNRAAARARLEQIVTAAIAPPAPPRRPTRPSRAAVERAWNSKRRHSELKRLRRPPEG